MSSRTRSGARALVAYRRPGETRAALLHDEAILELLVERDEDLKPADLLNGRILAVERSLNAAFVDVGLDQPGFLPLTGPLKKKPPHEGERRVLQVTRPEAGQKGLGLTAVITLESHHVAVTPDDPEIGVARSITAQSKRKNLKAALQEALPQGYGGRVLKDCSPETAIKEAIALSEQWITALNTKVLKGPPPLLWPSPPLWHGLARRAEDLRLQQLSPPPGLVGTPLLDEDADRLDEAIEQALSREAPFANGKGMLVFDRTEALTAIDVDGQLTPFDLAKAAFAEIPRQIRLRSLSGLIVIDAPKLKPTALKPLLDELRAGFQDDATESAVLGVTKGGLVEITRERTRPSLGEVFSRSPALTRALAAVWQAVRSARTEGRGRATLSLDPEAIDTLEARPHILGEAQNTFGVPITLKKT